MTEDVQEMPIGRLIQRADTLARDLPALQAELEALETEFHRRKELGCWNPGREKQTA